jgi:hypothetical protein
VFVNVSISAVHYIVKDICFVLLPFKARHSISSYGKGKIKDKGKVVPVLK